MNLHKCGCSVFSNSPKFMSVMRCLGKLAARFEEWPEQKDGRNDMRTFFFLQVQQGSYCQTSITTYVIQTNVHLKPLHCHPSLFFFFFPDLTSYDSKLHICRLTRSYLYTRCFSGKFSNKCLPYKYSAYPNTKI